MGFLDKLLGRDDTLKSYRRTRDFIFEETHPGLADLRRHRDAEAAREAERNAPPVNLPGRR